MEEMKMKISKLGEMKEKLISCMEAQLNQGIQAVDTKEAGEVIDMIKDLADAEKNCWKACYYKQIVEAMNEEKKESKSGRIPWQNFIFGMNDRPGYDNWRYSSGRFAPTGRGHFAGYVPMVDPYMQDWESQMQNGRMGYGNGGSSSGSSSGSSRGGNSGSSGSSGGSSRGGSSGGSSSDSSGYGGGRYGYPYEQYMDARRHYTESQSAYDKQEMNTHATEHMNGVMESMKEIWNDADPELRRSMKKNLASLMEGFN